MGTDTATIRVTRRTHDLLAEQARERGLSLAAMLEETARHGALRSEREAARAEAADRAARDEERAWDAAAGDGVG